LVLIIAVISAFLVKTFVLKSSDEGAASADQSVMNVHIVSPQSIVWPEVLSASGKISPWQEAIISTEANGLAIVELNVDVGDQVKAGDVLAVLSQKSVSASVKKAEASVAEAEASLNQAKSDQKRAEILDGTGALSAQKIVEYKIAVQTTQAKLDAAKADLDSAKIDMERTVILAADDGVITSRSATLGKVVTAGSELFRMFRQSKLEWQAEMNTEQISHVALGQKATISLTDGKTVSGSVRAISPALDQGTSRGIVYLTIEPGGNAISGSFVSGSISVGEKSALTVPLSSIVMRDGNSYVFIISDDSRAVRNQVITGRNQGNRVEIVDGLDASAKVVESGGDFLSDGSVVTVQKD